ncbi:AI-2E family transporter [Saccharicrinis aurantiacus]|uniref:AI-2E family transporter n=1 Tax=Saccharicrinis aurantiacus TaxID=1849719 RepID=UPI000AFE5682|nr:AI-2E family transporter [Saccharicrinis aurantiacus]
MMKDLKTTNILLLIIAVPIIFYLLKTLSFIFVPLVFAMFIALLFLPLMRWLHRKKVPHPISILLVIAIMIGFIKLGSVFIHLTSKELISTGASFVAKAEIKLVHLIVAFEEFFGISRIEGEGVLEHYIPQINVISNLTLSLDFIRKLLSGSLTTLFFVILLISGSINFENVLNSTLFKVKHSSVKAFRKIEKDIIKFVFVKFLISLMTGVSFGLACWFFDVSFPIFWGLFAFVINFVQMIGSVISVVALSLFAFVEIDSATTLLIFSLVITGIQVLFGGVLEPIFMGKTFSVNVITILIMLMFWGYIWGIPGLIMSIPLTVFVKIILDQFPRYRPITNLLIGKSS